MRTRSVTLIALLSVLAGTVAAQTPVQTSTEAAARPSKITVPSWLSKPTGEDVGRVYPRKALNEGVKGTATINCGVNAKGLLEQCSVLTEYPPGYEFGAAALRLADKFRMTPRVDGNSVKGGVVRIPIIFQAYDEIGAARVSLVTNPPWKTAPTAAEVKAAYPPKAAAVDGGAAVVRCDFKSDGTTETCKVMSETPRGLGFGAAARSLTGKFVLLMGSPSGLARVINADIPFSFRNPERASDVQPLSPQWTRTLTPAGAEQLFPAAARSAGVFNGLGTISCVATSSGALRDCSIVGEEPAALGFGSAALAAAGQIGLSPWTKAGEAVEGRRLTLPIRLKLDGPAPATP